MSRGMEAAAVARAKEGNEAKAVIWVSFCNNFFFEIPV